MTLTEESADGAETRAQAAITFERDPASYRHWTVTFDAPVAVVSMTVDAAGGLLGDYELKLNSYDIGVDIELADVIRRVRFEHPEIACVVLDSAIPGVFCAGANIGMLAAASHSHKVNFCKFTNETRLEMEEASATSGLRFLAAVNGACSGGGYELAMACDHILLIDDRASAVSLPEVPLLGVLPGTGGLTRLTDKRLVRRDHADVFATRSEGVQGSHALQWRLIDELASPSNFAAAVRARALELAETSSRDRDAAPLRLEPLDRTVTDTEIGYRYVSARLDRGGRTVHLTITASATADWTLSAARELDDLLCHLRFNEPELGTILVSTRGEVDDVLAHDQALATPASHAERETSLLWKRVLSRLDLTARSLIALVDPGSCFVGILAELVLAADRSYMLDGIFVDDDNPQPAAVLLLTAVNDGPMPMANGLSRIESRYWGRDDAILRVRSALRRPFLAAEAEAFGLVTFTPDDLDWEDEVRLALEERASFSPDALTGMEANHRWNGPETMATKIFARLSAWQNWIFMRPNASGPDGALQRYGSGSRASFDPNRT